MLPSRSQVTHLLRELGVQVLRRNSERRSSSSLSQQPAVVDDLGDALGTVPDNCRCHVVTAANEQVVHGVHPALNSESSDKEGRL
jgi:hypothetical protein